VETYVAWNLHEPKKDSFNFQGMADIVKFIETAQELGLFVIVRPGPYICAEWEFGGLPAWLLNEPEIRLRCFNESYLNRVNIFFDQLMKRLTPLLCTNGGPIIAIQLENEYGSYGNDKKYLQYLKEALISRGINVPLFTSDGPTDLMLQGGTLPEILKTINFGSNPEEALLKLREYQNDGPVLCTEYWNGWFDHWGENHHTRSYEDTANTLDKMLELGFSINLYMFHGGTNFGFYNGANYQNKYEPTITSYDYDSALTEDGEITAKYVAFQKVIKKYTSNENIGLPAKLPKKTYGKIVLDKYQSLWKSLESISQPIQSAYPLSMEKLGQNLGFILYETKVSGLRSNCVLNITDVHDRAMVYVNGNFSGVIYRGEANKELTINFDRKINTLHILVENMGRVNYGAYLMDYKGITENVRLDYQFQFEWLIYPLPLDNIDNLKFESSLPYQGPAFYKGTFDVDFPADTFLSLDGWDKGVAFINGFNLGRYWKVGPQKTLYLPGPLLKKGQNEIVIFELHDVEKTIVNLIDTPILG
jgi:beta-galactosidase